jgi:PIN domain nuclease of toxin-antitoxin system
MTTVLDSSALLALLWSEPGSEVVGAVLEESIMSAVNMAEVCSKLADRGIASAEVRRLLLDLPVKIVAFDEKQALRSGDLREPTRRYGLSIGDRACLGLAIAEGALAVTADRTWAELEIGVAIKAIR